VEHFVGRKMMNIDGIGEETAELLFTHGLVHNIADLYDLTPKQLLKLPGFGARSAERVMQGLADSKLVPYDRVIYALSIPFVGDTVAKKVAKAFPNIDALMAATAPQLAATKDIGPRIAESIVDFFANPVNRENIERLRAAGLQMAQESTNAAPQTNLLEGKSFVISGTFAKHSRDEYKALIEQHGGKNLSSISKKTDYVFAGENMGPAKLEKATALGIPIINEDTFLAMITPTTETADSNDTDSDNWFNSSNSSTEQLSLFD
jgi:DNA ligase (NAD+)